MSSHSTLWNKKRDSLRKREAQIESDLESASSDFEGKATKILIGAAVIGFVALSITYAARGSGKQKSASPKHKAKSGKKEKEVNAFADFRSVLINKITTTLLSFLVTYLGNLMATPSKQKEEEKES